MNNDELQRWSRSLQHLDSITSDYEQLQAQWEREYPSRISVTNAVGRSGTITKLYLESQLPNQEIVVTIAKAHDALSADWVRYFIFDNKLNMSHCREVVSPVVNSKAKGGFTTW